MLKTKYSDEALKDLSIDPSLSGSQMRNELIRMYNSLCYWSEEHSKWDTLKKEYEHEFEVFKDEFRVKKLEEIKQSGIKLTAQDKEAILSDIWEEEITTRSGFGPFKLKDYVASFLNQATKMELDSRQKMNNCSKCLDVLRTILSYDKIELQKMGE